MMNIPIETRLIIYRLVWIKLQEPELTTICSALVSVTYHMIDKQLGKELLDQDDILSSFPEILVHKPIDSKMFWFPVTDEYRQKRVEILYKIVHK